MLADGPGRPLARQHTEMLRPSGRSPTIALRASFSSARHEGLTASVARAPVGVTAGTLRARPVTVAPSHPESVAAKRPRIFLMLVLLAAALPYRVSTGVPIVNSVSILDILLVFGALTLWLDLAFRPIDVGYPQLFWLLGVPVFIAALSFVWSQDLEETLRSIFIYVEGLIAYLLVVRELSGFSTARVMTFVKRYAYLLIIPGVLLLLHVPGFGPQEQGLDETSGDYLSYYTRLSHPILGRSNNLATVLAFLAPLLLYWGHVRRDRRMILAAFVTLVAIFMTLSRGVLLALVLAGALYLLFTASPWRYTNKGKGRGWGAKVAATASLGLIAIAGLYTFNPATQEAFAERLSLANIEDRSELVSEAVDQVERRPLLGSGAGVNPTDDDDVVPVDGEVAEEPAHNTFLQQVVYFGIPLGVIVSLSLCAIPAFFLARRPNPLAGVIAYALIAQLVIFLFESSFEGTVLRVLFYLAIGLAVALLRSADAEPPAAEQLG
jgi:O-Antigen ligase